MLSFLIAVSSGLNEIPHRRLCKLPSAHIDSDVWAQKAARQVPQAPWSGPLAGRISSLALLSMVESGASVTRSRWKTCCLSVLAPGPLALRQGDS